MILVDDREGSQDIALHEPIRSMLDPCSRLPHKRATPPDKPCLECRDTFRSLSRLNSGDVLMSGNGPNGPVVIGVELKSIADLLSSTDNGRLQATQIPAMVADYDYSWVLYYGVHRPGPEGELQVLQTSQRTGNRYWQSYMAGRKTVPYGFLRALTIELQVLGLHVDHVATIEEAAQWIGCAYRWWQKPWADHRLFRTFDNSAARIRIPATVGGVGGGDGDLERVRLIQRAEVAARLPGIGYEKALALARAFGSVREMVNAGPDRWAEVGVVGKKGRVVRIGKVVAAAIEKAVG